jgi:hypothetical protein
MTSAPVRDPLADQLLTPQNGKPLDRTTVNSWEDIEFGAQKIVTDVATGMRRMYEYCYPLKDARPRRAYGVPSGVNNILNINKAVTPGRVTAIIVSERLGF